MAVSSPPPSKRWSLRLDLLPSGLGSRPRTLKESPPIAVSNLTGSFDSSALSSETSQAPTSSPSPSTVSSQSPLDWATRHAVIVSPTDGVHRFVPHPFQAALLEDRSPRRLVLKARQTGLSTVIALEALFYALRRPHERALFVSRNEKLAGLLIQYVQVALAGLSDVPRLVGESQSKLTFENGSEIVSLPANPSTGRGYPASRVYLDEAAFLAYDEQILQSILPTLSHGGQLTVVSTPRGRSNLFFRLWAGVEGGEWSKHEIHWSACSRYDDAWAEEMQASMTRQAWAEEYNCDFLQSGDAVFDPEDLERARVGHEPDPNGCSEYIHAWDLGRRHDHTVGITLGLRGEVWHVVRYERVLVPYPVVVSMIERRHKQLPGQTVVESNGIGDPVIEHLNVRVTPFTTTARTKVQAIQALQLLLQQGRFKHNTEQLHRELDLYSWDDEGLVTDSCMAAAFAAFAAQDPTRRYAAAFGKSGHLSTPPPPPLSLKEPIRDLSRLDELRAILQKQGSR